MALVGNQHRPKDHCERARSPRLTRLLLDQHISPALVRKLGGKGLYAEAVAHVGLSREPDERIWSYALEHDFAVVTTNARLHPPSEHGPRSIFPTLFNVRS